MTEAQAEAVVRLQLGQLAALERDEIFKEYNDLREQDRRLRGAAVQRAQHPRRHPRRPDRDARQVRRRPPTEITGRRPADVDMEDLIAEETNAVTISHNGYIKRLPLNTYRTPAPRRQGRLRRRDARRRFHRALLRRLDARLPAVLHQPRPAVLAEGVRHPAAEPHQRRAGPSPTCCRCKPEEKITSVIPVRALRRRPLPADGDAPRHGQEDAAGGLQPAASRAASSASAWTKATR